MLHDDHFSIANDSATPIFTILFDQPRTMIAILKSLLLVMTAVVATTSAEPEAPHKTGVYFRPSGSSVSGVPGTTAPYRRSPCPGLNSLANHGYIPRNGQDISRAALAEALMTVYNLNSDLAKILASQVPDPFSLDFLSTHNFIEHDASLVHADAYFGRPPTEVNATLAADFLARTNAQGTIGIEQVGKARKDRYLACMTMNPECTFGSVQAKNGFSEGAALIAAMGGRKNNDTICVTHAHSFLVEERIPSDYVKPAVAISLADLGAYSLKIAAFAQ